MRKVLTALCAATATVPLAFLAAAPASAAPTDVVAQFSTAGTPDGLATITAEFDFTGGAAPGECGFGLNDESYQEATKVVVVQGSTSATVTRTAVPAGTYSVEWFCDGNPENWGTPNLIVPGSTPTDTASTLVVVAGEIIEVPEVPEPGCSGSVCLPTGSFAF